MRNSVVRVGRIAAIVMAAAGSACSVSNETAALRAPTFARPSVPATAARLVWGAPARAKATFVREAHFDRMAVHVQVALRDEAGLERFARNVSDPSSPEYRHFLTPTAIADRFGASREDYAKVATYFVTFGASVGGWPQRLLLTVDGTQHALERAFGTTFGVYRQGGATFVAPDGVPTFARALPIRAIGGIVAVQTARRELARAGSGNFIGLSPPQLANAYDYAGAYRAGLTGAGVTIGIIGTGAVGANDVPAFGALFHQPTAKVAVVAAAPQSASTANGQTGTAAFDPHPGGLTAPPPASQTQCTGDPTLLSPGCVPEDVETQLDTEQAAALAPGATVDDYLAYNPSDCSLFSTFPNYPPSCAGVLGLYLTDDEIQQIIGDNVADVVSGSYGLGDGELGALAQGYFDAVGQGPGPVEFAALAAEGIAVFFASGDSGASECVDPSTGVGLGIPCVAYPASDPSVTAVGAANTPVDAAGNLTGAITAWGDLTTRGIYGGSGGGISQLFPPEVGQAGLVPAGGSPLTMRGVPDLSLNGDPLTGATTSIYGGATVFGVGGTSASAPDAAAMWALVLQACNAAPACKTATGAKAYRLGNPAPLLYAIFNGSAGSTSSFKPQLPYPSVFYDITVGSNGANLAPGPVPGGPGQNVPGYVAGTGYNLVTGIGAPFAGHLIQAITGLRVL